MRVFRESKQWTMIECLKFATNENEINCTQFQKRKKKMRKRSGPILTWKFILIRDERKKNFNLM